ncbi:MAG: hypothetical protein LC114_03475 [Bryobacterales bacterium]|nr:hypothetical protein [Bryobacterales bacterium]
MKHVTAAEAEQIIVQTVGLDPSQYDCCDVEVLAALLRRAASFQCPCSARALVRDVGEPLERVLTAEDLASELERVLDDLLAYGDLVEVKDAERGALVYTTPPSFVRLGNGRILLLGVAPECVDWLPATLGRELTCRGHVRSIPPTAEPVASILRDAGYYELPHKLWLQAPKAAPAREVYEMYLEQRQGTGRLAEATGITILDSARPVRYYKGRWRPATGSGDFVARREQRYGAPLWAFIGLKDGHLTSLLDLPLEGNALRGCDEAWWLQAAIDAKNGTPQFAELLPTAENDWVRLRFFGPLPRWAQRQLDVIGEPEPAKRSLFSCRIPASDLEFTRAFLAEHMWMTIMPGKGDDATP